MHCLFTVFCILAEKSSRLGALQHLGEKGDKMTAMLIQVREILPKYRSGALPKVFKVLPKFEAWEEVCKTYACSNCQLNPMLLCIANFVLFR